MEFDDSFITPEMAEKFLAAIDDNEEVPLDDFRVTPGEVVTAEMIEKGSK